MVSPFRISVQQHAEVGFLLLCVKLGEEREGRKTTYGFKIGGDFIFTFNTLKCLDFILSVLVL